ncbi:unnamed protein product, partial [Rotaria magnacalcarata]
STIAMDVPLRPQEVHDLVNRVGRLITSYAQEFLPDDIYIYSKCRHHHQQQIQQMN